jgi:transglutaminase-like putative cysteine protease
MTHDNPYLEPTDFIDSDSVSVRDKAFELTRGAEDERQKAVRLFSFVRDEIRYNVFSERSRRDHYRASRILSRREGYCVQKAVLLAALARAAGIPARLRFAQIRNHLLSQQLLEKRGTNLFAYHGYTEVFIKGRWAKATPCYDLGYCKRAGLPPVHFDGKADAMLPLFALDGKPHIDYIQDRGAYPDLPFEEIQKASLSKKYLSDYRT